MTSHAALLYRCAFLLATRDLFHGAMARQEQGASLKVSMSHLSSVMEGYFFATAHLRVVGSAHRVGNSVFGCHLLLLASAKVEGSLAGTL